jgi:hypothetical protein
MLFGLLLEFTKFALKVSDTNHDSATRRTLFSNVFPLPFPTTCKNFPTVYGTQKFITLFTTGLHWHLSSERPIQSISHHPISLTSTLILSYHLGLGLPSCLFHSGFSMKFLYGFLVFPFMLHDLPISSSFT